MNASSLIGHVLEILERTDKTPEPSDRVVAAFFRDRRYLGSHDRRHIAEILFSIIRYRRTLETLLELYLAAQPAAAALDAPHQRYLTIYTIYALLLELGAMPGAPEIKSALPSPQYWNTLFPGVDRQSFLDWLSCHRTPEISGGDEIVRFGVRYSFQDWMVNEWMDQLGEETPGLLEALNTPARTTLRVNSLRGTRDECRRKLAEEGIETSPTAISPAGLVARKRFNAQSSASFREGWYELQDEGSQMISMAASPEPGARVIDACSGAGGKSLHLAALMEGRGDILAIDVDKGRLRELRLRAARAGVNIIRPALREEVANESLAGSADLVLVDAPCSGAGTIRRNPWLKWKLSEDSVVRYAARELDILNLNAPFVKPGGVLLYATCSLFRKENHEVIERFLGGNPSFIAAPLPKEGGLPAAGEFPHELTLFPHRYDTDGFFISRLQRTG